MIKTDKKDIKLVKYLISSKIKQNAIMRFLPLIFVNYKTLSIRPEVLAMIMCYW